MTIAGVEIAHASFFSTHHASPHDAVLARTRAATHPTYPLLVARARRFTSLVTQLHLEVCGAVVDSGRESMPVVFATCHGEIQTAEVLIADLFASKVVSSARFALSVHNTAAGLYSVATGSAEPSTTVTGANAVAAGWLEAALTALDTGKPTLLSIADEPVPEVFHGPDAVAGVAAAFVVTPATGHGQRAELALTSASPALDPTPDVLHTLACAADAVKHRRAAAIRLGAIAPSAMLELRMEAMP